MNLNMIKNSRARLVQTVTLLAGAMLVPSAAMAQDEGPWRTSATLYMYLPSVSGKTAFPSDSGTPINISLDQILNNLKMVFMGALDVHNGRWGAFTDVIYLDLGHGRSQSRDFTIGDAGLPVGVTADLNVDLKSWVWTLAGQYRVMSDPALTVDLIGGARMLDLTERLKWNISGDLGSLPPVSRTGNSEVSQTIWDGVVGAKGRYVFGASREWSVPFYFDVGAGGSTSTFQAAAGIGYGFKWGELSGLWRYLDYNLKANRAIQDVRFSGPMIGATFRW
jgi:hypothetical protein